MRPTDRDAERLLMAALRLEGAPWCPVPRFVPARIPRPMTGQRDARPAVQGRGAQQRRASRVDGAVRPAPSKLPHVADGGALQRALTR